LGERPTGNNTVRTKDSNDFDQIENKFSGLDNKKQSSYGKPSKQVVEEPEQTEMAENIQNPYAQTNLNSNISFAKNKYQQQSIGANKRSHTPNQFVVNNNQNNFDFNRGSNQMNNNNQFDFLRNSNTNNFANINNNQPNFNFSQNSNNAPKLNQGTNFNQNVAGNNKMGDFDFGMIDFTNSGNNLQQNVNNLNNGMNFYQNNQSQVHNMGNAAISMNNNLNTFGITTGIPTTNFNFPTNTNQNVNTNKKPPQNNDIFSDFFK
jgi:hypothetical protein